MYTCGKRIKETKRQTDLRAHGLTVVGRNRTQCLLPKDESDLHLSTGE